MSEQIPPVAVLIIHEVEDYDKWRPLFDQHQKARADAGALGHHINRGADNPNLLAVYMAATDKDKTVAMLSNDSTRAKMREAGVKGTPDIKIMKPVSNDSDMEGQLASLIVSHKVNDYAKWREAYDALDARRKELGIVGHAVSQAYDDPNTVVVYHQAKSLETLKSFMAAPELKEAMEKAGVASEPEVSFWNAESGAMY